MIIHTVVHKGVASNMAKTIVKACLNLSLKMLNAIISLILLLLSNEHRISIAKGIAIHYNKGFMTSYKTNITKLYRGD